MKRIEDFFVNAVKNKEYGLIVITLLFILIVLAGWFGIYWILWDWIVVSVFGFTRFKLTYLEFVGFSLLVRWILPSFSSKDKPEVKIDATIKEDDK